MSRTRDSRRTVFRRIAGRRHTDWPAYDATPLYDRGSLDGLESDIRTVSRTWFGHDRHESVEQFVRSLPLVYFNFNAHGRYAGPTRYEFTKLTVPSSRTYGAAERALDAREDGLTHCSSTVSRPIDSRVVRVSDGLELTMFDQRL